MAIKSPHSPKKPSNIIRLTLFWAIFVIAVLTGVALLSPQDKLKEVPISTVISEANSGNVSKIEVQGNNLKITPKGDEEPTQKSTKDPSSSLQEQGLKSDAPVEVVITQPSNTGDVLWNLAIIIVPVLLIAGFFFLMMRQAQGQKIMEPVMWSRQAASRRRWGRLRMIFRNLRT